MRFAKVQFNLRHWLSRLSHTLGIGRSRNFDKVSDDDIENTTKEFFVEAPLYRTESSIFR